MTYLGASLMVVYLPIAFLKDWLCNLLKRRRSSKSGKALESIDNSSACLDSPLKYIGGQEMFELEPQGILTSKDSDIDLSKYEEGVALVPKSKEGVAVLKHEKELTTREVAMCGFYIAPIWFVTEVSLTYTDLSTFPHSDYNYFWP